MGLIDQSELMRHRVLIIHSSVKHYREPFFDALYDALAKENIKFRLVFGQPTPQERTKGDTFVFERPWAIPVENRWFFGERLLYQPAWDAVKWADLVIVEQANKHLINYPLLLQRLQGKKVAFWGHGRNRQTCPKDLRERFKRLLIGAPDWWFAYTMGVAEYLVKQGIRPDIITIVQNSLDTKAFRLDLSAVTVTDLQNLRQRHGLAPEAMIGLYCGSLYQDKQIGFLLESARRIKAQVPEFHLIIVGGGAQASLAEDAACNEDWIHFSGPRFGVEKAGYFRLADFFLSPGMVGLSILDAFCAGLPMLTTDYPGHSPEIDYLESGINGLCSTFEPGAFASLVTTLCNDQALLIHLRNGAKQSGEKYSLEAMVANFCNGVCRCLGS